VNAEVVVVIVQGEFGDIEREGRETDLVRRGADTQLYAVLLAAGALEIADHEGDEIRGHFGRGLKGHSVLFAQGAQSLASMSLAIGVFAIAVSPLSIVSFTWNVALKAGSSKQGKARRASVDSNCVTA